MTRGRRRAQGNRNREYRKAVKSALRLANTWNRTACVVVTKHPYTPFAIDYQDVMRLEPGEYVTCVASGNGRH